MAFESVTGKSVGGFTSLAKLPQGQAVEGYLVDIIKNEKFPNACNLVFQLVDGSSRTIGASGDLKYFLADARMPEHTRDITLNVMTRLTNTGSRATKRGVPTTTFDLQQDKSAVKPGAVAISYKAQINGPRVEAKPVDIEAQKAETQSKAAALMAELEGKSPKKVSG